MAVRSATQPGALSHLLGEAEREAFWRSLFLEPIVVSCLGVLFWLLHRSDHALPGAQALLTAALPVLAVWLARWRAGPESWRRMHVLGYAAAAVHGLAVGWYFAQAVHDILRLAPFAFFAFLGLTSLRYDAGQTAFCGLLYALEMALLEGARLPGRGPGRLAPAIRDATALLQPLLILCAGLFLAYVVRFGKSLVERFAQRAAEQHARLVALTENLEERVEERSLQLREATWRQAALLEREEIAQELHDGLAKALAGLALGLEALERRAARQEDVRSSLRELSQLSEHLVRETRAAIARVRRPLGLPDLAEAVRQGALRFSADTGIAVDLALGDAIPQVDEDVAGDLLAVVAECLDNIRRHAGATHVHLTFQVERAQLLLSVADDGRGMPGGWSLPALAEGGHFGLVGTHERARRLGGTLRIQGQGPWGGLAVTLAVPLRTCVGVKGRSPGG